MRYILLATALAITPASAATIDLGAISSGAIEVYNPYDHEALFNFYGGGYMLMPTGFNMSDNTTWYLATMATYNITVSGGTGLISSMSICNEATNVPSAHPCGYTTPMGHGYVSLAPGPTTLNYFGYMSGNPYGRLASASLSYDDQFVVATTPLPGAAILFLSGLLLLGWRTLRNA